MKAKLKPHKLLSMLLALVMLLSLLPTTALAADYNEVKVNGVSLGDGKYLASNTATTANSSSTKPSSYVAWYKDGTLTLNGYEGTGIVLQGAPAADLIIKLIGNNTITSYDVGIQGNTAAGSITITSDSKGTLTINVNNSSSVFGINGYANSVTITGSADVKIIAEGTANQESYGIKSDKDVSILENASVNITCKTPNSTSRSDSCNGIFSERNVTIDTDGTIQIDVYKAGDEAYSYGIKSMSNLTLTKVGEMTVKWKKFSVYGVPLSPSSASFPAEYDTNETTATDVDGTTYYITTYRPKGATPTGNYPDYVRVYNGSGTITSLSDGQYLAANAATGASDGYTDGTSYVARYDKSTGTLYLNGYQNDHQIIAPDSVIFANGDLNIEVVSDSGFSTSVSATNDLYGIRANGTLTISGSGKLTVTANGNGDVYGIYANEGVTISAPLDVNVGKVDSSTNGPVHGIYAQSGTISLSGNDMTVTATDAKETVYGVYNAADTSTAITENGNITISGNLTVNLSKGNNRGISSQGGVITLEGATVKIPGNYRYGIFNRNGNVVIKSTSDVDISSDISNNNGICTYSSGDLTIENSAVKVSADGPAAELKGNVSIKDSMVDLTRTSSYYEVIKTGNSSATNTIDLSGSGSVTLTASGNQEYAMISGPVSLGTNTKLEKGKEDGTTYDGEYDGSSKTVLQFVHDAAAPATYTVSFDANGGTGTMADVTGVSGEYTLPENGFTAPDGKQFKAWSVGGVEKAAGDKITVTANTTVTAVWEDAPVTPAINSVTVSPATAEVVKGKTQQFTATVDKTGDIAETVTWSVNSTKSTISDTGLLTVGADETAKTLTVTATSTADTTKSGTATVTVKVPVFHITVINGNVTDGAGNSLLAVPEGAEIIFTANEPETGKQFKEWTGLDGVEFVDGTSKTSSTAKIKMPARAVTATAVYEDAPNANPAKPTISVNGTYTYTGSAQTATVSGYDSATMNITGNVGTNAGGYTVSVTSKTGKWADGTTDAVTADWSIQKANPTYEVPTGLEGTKGNALSTVTLPAGFTWADGTTEMNTTGNQTFPATFTPSDTDNYNVVNNISVTVNVKEAAPTTYEVTVTNGTGGGNYEEDATVTITANAAPADKVFDKWEVVSGSITLADVTSATTTFTMPAGAVSVKATYKDKPVTTYTVTVNGSYASTTGAGEYAVGETVNISAGSRSGYTFDGWTSSNVTITNADSRNASFVMPEKNVTVTAHWTHNAVPVTPTEPSTYTIKVEKTDNGDVTSSHKTASKGTIVTLTVEPDKGYTLETLTVTDKNGDEIELTNKGDGKYTFKMPASKVYVEATFMEDNSMLNFFVDVFPGDYYYDAVLWAAKNGITGGVDDTHFAPNATCTRAQAVTFLWRAAGSPAPKSSEMPFEDVAAGSYYYDAVLWAVENGITKGSSKTMFSPNATCTRAQIVTFLWRSQGVPAAGAVNPFTDVAADAYYNTAVLWAAENGITGGTSATTFSPNNDCTRAQIVTFLYRYFVK